MNPPDTNNKRITATVAMALTAAASGHWDWKRASMADLVELSRRNKASRAAD